MGTGSSFEVESLLLSVLKWRKARERLHFSLMTLWERRTDNVLGKIRNGKVKAIWRRKVHHLPAAIVGVNRGALST